MESQGTDEGTNQKKIPMSQEERLQLATKLDKELDDFIENLPKRQQPSGAPDPNWLEEFDNHPFFMKKMPEPGEKLHPLYEGLQQLKYDPNENSPEELALSYKEDGNFNFKHKNYRLAAIAYTEGIKVKCGVVELEASLYNNRSAAHWYLQNYRSSLRDAEWALKFNPTYVRALHRAANCCYQLKKYAEAIAYCDQILDNTKSPEILNLRKKSLNGMKENERNSRKKQLETKKQGRKESQLLEEIKNRGIRIEGDNLELSLLEPQFPEIANHRVYLNEDNVMVWPVVFIYPEHKTMDFIQQFSENSTFSEHLDNVFAEKPNWDVNNEYKVSNLEIFFEYDSKSRVKRVKKSKTLGEVLTDPSFIISGGTPCFIILVSGSKAEEEFLSSY